MTALAVAALAVTVTAPMAGGGDWYDTVPAGSFRGDVYWVQNQYDPWVSWERDGGQYVGTAEFTIRNGRINGFMDLPVEAVRWWDRLDYPVKFYNEETPREWREYKRYPWLFRVLSLHSTGAALRTGELGQYSPWNIHVEWLYGVSALGLHPETGASFRWRGLEFRWHELGGRKYVKAYGYWQAFPSQHYMSLGFEVWEVQE